MPERYEYKVLEVRESMVGGKMSGGKLEKLLNEYASQGWQLKAITSADVKGRVGPGGPRASLSPSSAVSARAPPHRDLNCAGGVLAGALWLPPGLQARRTPHRRPIPVPAQLGVSWRVP